MISGPKPKPTNVKRLQGTLRPERENKNEPQPESVAPPRPDHLSVEAKAEWDRIVPELLAVRTLSRLDLGILAAYCQAYGRWTHAETKLAEIAKLGQDPELMTAPSGYPVRSEWLNIANKAMDQIHKFGVELGLSAASRSRVKSLPEKKAASTWGNFGKSA